MVQFHTFLDPSESAPVTEPYQLSAVEARRLIGRKKLSPVELMQSCLTRIAAVNPAVNAVTVLDEDAALDLAKSAEKRIMSGGTLDCLDGMPVGIKDLHAVEGMRSTWGSLIFKDFIPEQDDALVSTVRASGGLPFCKTNVPEFGAGANTTNKVFGATGNPFDPTLTAAGSSGGAACALALDMMPLATGSDYGGSLRTPAAFCGVVGFRVSSGLVPGADKPAGLLPWGVLGPMARTVDDAYLLLRGMLTVNRLDPFSSMEAFDWPERLEPADLAGVRIAYSADFGQAPVAKNIRRVFAERVKLFAGAFLDADETTPDFSGIHDVFDVHRNLSFVASHQDKLATQRHLLGPNVLSNTEEGLKMTASEIARGYIEQQKLMRRVHDFFDDYDVLIAPAAAVSPFPHSQLFVEEIDGERMRHYMHWLALVYAPTMALCCALALPCGRDDNGLPFGIQIIGPRGHDRRVLEVGLALEAVLADRDETRRPIPEPVLMAAKAPAKKSAAKGGKSAR